MQSLVAHTALRRGSNGVSDSRALHRSTVTANRLLGRLPEPERCRLLSIAERVSLRPRQVIQERSLPLRHAYFLESGLASLQTWGQNGQTVEVRSIGRSDMVGLSIALGIGRSPRRCVMQVGGTAMRVPAAELANFLDTFPHARKVFLAYVHTAIGHGAQVLTCNTCHSVRDRVSRWLLATADQLKAFDLPVTHACIARSLSVRRASVTDVIGCMERQNLVKQSRGVVSLINSTELERQGCGCYRVIREYYQRTPQSFAGNGASVREHSQVSIAN